MKTRWNIEFSWDSLKKMLILPLKNYHSP